MKLSKMYRSLWCISSFVVYILYNNRRFAYIQLHFKLWSLFYWFSLSSCRSHSIPCQLLWWGQWNKKMSWRFNEVTTARSIYDHIVYCWSGSNVSFLLLKREFPCTFLFIFFLSRIQECLLRNQKTSNQIVHKRSQLCFLSPYLFLVFSSSYWIRI